MLDRLNDTLGLMATLRRSGMIAPLRPDKYLRIASVMRRENLSADRLILRLQVKQRNIHHSCSMVEMSDF